MSGIAFQSDFEAQLSEFIQIQAQFFILPADRLGEG